MLTLIDTCRCDDTVSSVASTTLGSPPQPFPILYIPHQTSVRFVNVKQTSQQSATLPIPKHTALCNAPSFFDLQVLGSSTHTRTAPAALPLPRQPSTLLHNLAPKPSPPLQPAKPLLVLGTIYASATRLVKKKVKQG